MKVLMAINATRDSTRGATRLVEHLGNAMEDLGAEVDFLFREDINPKLIRVRPNLSVLTDSPVFLYRRIRLLKAHAYDVVEISWTEGYLWGAIRRLSGKRRPAYVFRSHGLANRAWELYLEEGEVLDGLVSWKGRFWYPCLLLPQERLAIRTCDAVAVTSSDERNFLIDRLNVPCSKIVLVPPGVSDSLLAREIPRKDLDMLFVGRWKAVKGVKYLVGAVCGIWKEFPNLGLTVVGADEREVRASFPEQFHSRVRVYGQLEHEALAALLLRHKILLFPSLFESFGMVFLEALAAGCVTVATPVGGAKDLIEDGKDGFLIPRRSSEAIAETVKRVVKDENLLQEVGEQARRKAQNYTWNKAAEKMIAAYRDLF